MSLVTPRGVSITADFWASAVAPETWAQKREAGQGGVGKLAYEGIQKGMDVSAASILMKGHDGMGPRHACWAEHVPPLALHSCS